MLALLTNSAPAAFIGGGVAHPAQRTSTIAATIMDPPSTPTTVIPPDADLLPDGVLRRNTQGGPWVEQRARPRRNRKSEAMRKMVRETIVTPSNFIYPLVRTPKIASTTCVRQ